MRRMLLCLCGLGLLLGGQAAAQEPGLTIEDVSITTQIDAFGLETRLVTGFLINQTAAAYDRISLYAEVYDVDDELIGEGFGYLVLACGEALLPDFIMQPGMTEAFAIQLDLFDPEAEIDRVEIIPEVSATETPARQGFPALLRGVIEVARREVVVVEWLDADTLRYGVGCWRDLFTEHDWYEYNVRTGLRQPVEHPRAASITDTLRSTINLSDPALFARSFFTFAPGERRAVYQTELNTLVTAEPDGSFGRVLYDSLYNITLQGVYFPFASGGVFVAYYFGGYGDPVSYVTANVNGQQLSQSPKDPGNVVNLNPDLTSLTLPGISPDGRRVIVMREVNGQTAYYLRATDTDFIQHLFDAPPPGNNWPPPLYHIPPEGGRFVYLAQPADDGAMLRCFNITSGQLTDLTRLSLSLPSDARGWMWMSPDGERIALAANGASGGLWLIDLTALPSCD